MLYIYTWACTCACTCTCFCSLILHNDHHYGYCREETKEMSYKERVKRKKLQNESYSLWMDMLYRLSLANHVSAQNNKHQVIWSNHLVIGQLAVWCAVVRELLPLSTKRSCLLMILIKLLSFMGIFPCSPCTPCASKTYHCIVLEAYHVHIHVCMIVYVKYQIS